MPPKRQPRWESNGVSPSKYRSPTRLENAVNDDDKDELVWSREECLLSEEDLSCYLLCTKHLHEDVSLIVLREYDYDMSAAVQFCASVETPEALSPLEQKVLLAAAPFPDTRPGLKKSISEAHVYSLIPHVSKADARNFYARCGRDGYVFPRPWTPRHTSMLGPALNNLIKEGFLSIDDNSGMYDRPGKRVTRSQADDPQQLPIPRRLNAGNDLHIAMVGYDQSRDEDGLPVHTTRRKKPSRPSHSEPSTVSSASGASHPFDVLRQPTSSSTLPPSASIPPPVFASSVPPPKRSTVTAESLQRLINHSLSTKPQLPPFASITPKGHVRVSTRRDTVPERGGEERKHVPDPRVRNSSHHSLPPPLTMRKKGPGRPKKEERRMSDVHDLLKREETTKTVQLNGTRHSFSPYKRSHDADETTARRMNRQKLFIDMEGWDLHLGDAESTKRVTRATPTHSRDTSRASSPLSDSHSSVSSLRGCSSLRPPRPSSFSHSLNSSKRKLMGVLDIDMVGWNKRERDSDGFAVPSLPRWRPSHPPSPSTPLLSSPSSRPPTVSLLNE